MNAINRQPIGDPTHHNYKHGLCHLPEYRAWQTMRLRCFNRENEAYPDYGGRGITVCDSWKDDFMAFYADMGPKPSPEFELDRRDNNGNYEPGNCRWVTRSVNDRNRRNNYWVELNGERVLFIELCEAAGLRCDTVRLRMKAGQTLERALSKPARPKRANGILAAELAARIPIKTRTTPDQQATVVQLFISGKTYDQIVEITGVSYNTVGRIIKRHGAVRSA